MFVLTLGDNCYFGFAFLVLFGTHADGLENQAELSAKQKQEIVDKHNELRRKEGASNMEKMVWNDYLAEMGKKWAEGCYWKHGFPQNMIPKAPYDRSVGQNLFMSRMRLHDQMALDGLERWYREKPDYDFSTLSCRAKMCGHYTQVVWAGSRAVGCGFRVCPVIYPRKWQDTYYLVCNYGPAGNVYENYRPKAPYKKGPACSACPERAPHCDNGLCSATVPQSRGYRSMSSVILLISSAAASILYM